MHEKQNIFIMSSECSVEKWFVHDVQVGVFLISSVGGGYLIEQHNVESICSIIYIF